MERHVLERLFWIGIAGGFGAMARYAIGEYMLSRFSAAFPLGTLLVNVTGSFLLGFLLSGGVGSTAWPSTTRLAVTTGFLGAYTTFSTWSVETLQLIESGYTLLAVINVIGSVCAGLLGAYFGFRLGRLIGPS